MHKRQEKALTHAYVLQATRWFALATTVVLGVPHWSAAQNVGTLTGTVTDAQGLAIPGAAVTLVNRVSQTSQDAFTDESGRYTLNNLPFGTYLLSVLLAGFAPVEQVVEIQSTVPLVRNVELGVGGVAETVTVASKALLVETSWIGSRISLGASLLDQLPTATPSKQVSSMLLSVPGFIPSQNGRIHVRGSHGQIQYVVDGVPMTDEFSEAFSNPLDPQYVKSAAVLTGGIPAEYGNRLAAVVDVTSRSGLDASKNVAGTANLNLGRFGAVDGGFTFGGRVGSRLGYFASAGGNRTDRYLDPPTSDNFHNTGHASRITGKVEIRPTDTDFVRLILSHNRSRFDVPNDVFAEQANVDGWQRLTDNSQTVTWLHQLGRTMTTDVLVYRRAARPELDLATGVPIAATQDRTLDHQGASVSLSYAHDVHRLKTGLQFDRNPVAEQFFVAAHGADPNDPDAARFDPAQGGMPFAFDRREVGTTLGLFAQDTISPNADLSISLGLRYDRYRLLIEESAVSPRVGVAYHLHPTETVVRASYDRLFMPPFSENLLVSSSAQARALSPNRDLGGGLDVRPERQHAYEVGVQQALVSVVRLGVSYYRKNMRNVADVDQFRDTTVTFPISVSKGVAQGIEMRLDVPPIRGVSGYASLSRATTLLTAPLNGGLFLGALPEAGKQFFADHDQRWQSQSGISYEHPSRRVFASFTMRVDSGIPFFAPADFDSAAFEDPLALTLVDLDRGRAKPRAIANLLVGSKLYRRGSTNVELRVGMLNVFNTTHLLNFLSIFNGTHYGPPRTWTTQLAVNF
jgi:outer membrane receptor for ferrienterochelin and colicin